MVFHTVPPPPCSQYCLPVQVYGGYGFTEEFPVARIYRDARVSRIYEGTNEINRIFIADRLAKSGLAPAVDSQIAKGGVADLAILDYVSESVRYRADRFHSLQPLADAFEAWAAPKRLAAASRAAVSTDTRMPNVDWEAIGG